LRECFLSPFKCFKVLFFKLDWQQYPVNRNMSYNEESIGGFQAWEVFSSKFRNSLVYKQIPQSLPGIIFLTH